MCENLEWLARNVGPGDWPEWANYVARLDDGLGFSTHLGYYSGSYSYSEWRGTRERLQGKPDWGDSPEWASYLAQDQDGTWTWFSTKPRKDHREWFSIINKIAGDGEVISHWASTLESRPEPQFESCRCTYSPYPNFWDQGEATKHDDGKPDVTLVDPEFREEVARVLGFGEAKYGRDNWKGGLDFSRLLDAVHRHLAACEKGEDLDPETGLSHAAHAAAGLMMYDWTRKHKSELDSRRYKTQEQGVSQVRQGTDDEKHSTEPDQATGLGVHEVHEREGQSVDSGPSPTLEGLTKRVVDWADSVFPDRTEEAALRKMMLEELPELLNGGRDDPGEYADVLILLVDIAHMRSIDIVAAGHAKMAVNEGRSWKRDPVTGSIKHV